MSTRTRLRAALHALPTHERESHVYALAALLHLLEHCPEGREPGAFVAGRAAFQVPAVQWAAAQLARPLIECPAPDCIEPNHITLMSTPGTGAMP